MKHRYRKPPCDFKTIISDIVRLPGQGGSADSRPRNLRAELLAAEAEYYAKKHGKPKPEDESTKSGDPTSSLKRPIEATKSEGEVDLDDPEVKRRRQIFLEFCEVDADDSESESSESSDEEYVKAIIETELGADFV